MAVAQDDFFGLNMLPMMFPELMQLMAQQRGTQQKTAQSNMSPQASFGVNNPPAGPGVKTPRYVDSSLWTPDAKFAGNRIAGEVQDVFGQSVDPNVFTQMFSGLGGARGGQ